MTDSKDNHAPTPDPEAEGGFLVDEATDAVLRLHLDEFEGPFEVLLYLIKAQEIDIFDIPIVKVTEQYLRFLEIMREENLDVAGEFLVLAATLIQIKSKMLLPSDVDTDEDEQMDEEDPRIELVEKLIEYRRYRDITERLQRLEEERENWYTRNVKPEIEPDPEQEEELLELTLFDLVEAFRGVLRFFNEDVVHTVVAEGASVDEKVAYIEERLAQDGSIAWTDLFRSCRSRVEMVCSFLAVLELIRMGRIKAHQSDAFEEIRIFPKHEEMSAA
ncbi:MAG: segregation/condensation protein A [FCB group bacterium]|jgi:segregation and condensation protein A|nr:segregation/condensation protein A [FCB group bacterium]